MLCYDEDCKSVSREWIETQLARILRVRKENLQDAMTRKKGWMCTQYLLLVFAFAALIYFGVHWYLVSADVFDPTEELLDGSAVVMVCVLLLCLVSKNFSDTAALINASLDQQRLQDEAERREEAMRRREAEAKAMQAEAQKRAEEASRREERERQTVSHLNKVVEDQRRELNEFQDGIEKMGSTVDEWRGYLGEQRSLLEEHRRLTGEQSFNTLVMQLTVMQQYDPNAQVLRGGWKQTVARFCPGVDLLSVSTTGLVTEGDVTEGLRLIAYQSSGHQPPGATLTMAAPAAAPATAPAVAPPEASQEGEPEAVAAAAAGSTSGADRPVNGAGDAFGTR